MKKQDFYRISAARLGELCHQLGISCAEFLGLGEPAAFWEAPEAPGYAYAEYEQGGRTWTYLLHRLDTSAYLDDRAGLRSLITDGFADLLRGDAAYVFFRKREPNEDWPGDTITIRRFMFPHDAERFLHDHVEQIKRGAAS